jgi:rubrerythrin
MPRTKGAKNKEKPLEFYLKKVEELTGKAPPVKVVKQIKEKAEKVAEVVENPAKKAFEILKPKKETPPPDINGEVYRCGNPACGKVLDGAVNKCPYCGVNLQWQ